MARDVIPAVAQTTSSAPSCSTPPSVAAEDTLKSTADVELDGRRHHISWPRQSTLVDVMLAAGIDVPHSCREGRCGSCVCTVVSGEVDMAHSDILDPEDRQAGLILACRSRPVSDIVHIEF